MKAIQVKNYGGTELIHINEDVKQPSLAQGQILVEVHATSLNRIDTAIRSGYMQQMLPLTFPLTLAGDYAGIVVEVGDGVTDLKRGDAVFGNAGHFKGGSGSLAEFVAAPSNNSSLKPKLLSFHESAAIPLVGTSAIQGIEEEIKIKTGQKILIQGGAGGIGSLAIQLAKLQGAYVAATVGTDDVQFAKNLGADEVIDYKTQDVTKVIKEYDAVFDTAGGEHLNKLFSVLKKGGILVTMAGQPDQELAKQHEVKAVSQMTKVSSDQLKKLAEYVDTGKLEVQIEKMFPFAEVKEAFTYFETQHPRGKIVVKLR